MNVYENLGITPVINASGPVTRLGGALMKDDVFKAMKEASGYSVSLEELQGVASQKISELTDTEAAIVTCGASSALTLGAAAIIAELNLSRISKIPALSFTPEFLVAHHQRNSYDRAISLTGGKIINIGLDDITSGAGVRGVELWEYDLERTEHSVAVLYTIGDKFVESDLKFVVDWAHQANLKVIVDAAASLPPVENLKLIPGTGADLVCFSGGKAIGGPQSSGILCGQKKLVASALLQLLDWDEHMELWNPAEGILDKNSLAGLPRHGIGRGMKVGKEEIIGLLKALELFTPEEVEANISRYLIILNHIIENIKRLKVHCELNQELGKYPVLNIQLDTESSQQNAFQLCQRLRDGHPRIFPGHGRLNENIIQINPACLKEGDESTIIQRLNEELKM